VFVLSISEIMRLALFALGRAVLDFYWCTVFPRSAEKPYTDDWLPQAHPANNISIYGII
jgi:hypothetical protein